jgi:ribosomal protein L37AE/L43A
LASLKRTLKKHSVTLADEKRLLLQCNRCGKSWSPNISSEKRLPKGYWKCPNKCNYQEREYKHSPDVRAYFAKRNREQISKKRNDLEPKKD